MTRQERVEFLRSLSAEELRGSGGKPSRGSAGALIADRWPDWRPSWT